MKICSKCKIEKSLDSYYNSRRYKDGKQHRCIECCKAFTQAATKRWREENPDSHKISIRKTKASLKYGKTLDELDKMLIDQDFKCLICRKSIRFDASDKRDKPHVDHSHETGTVRGLLCLTCNTGLGMFGDSSELLKAATKYLDNAVQAERLSESASDKEDAIVRSYGNDNHKKLVEITNSAFISE